MYKKDTNVIYAHERFRVRNEIKRSKFRWRSIKSKSHAALDSASGTCDNVITEITPGIRRQQGVRRRQECRARDTRW